MTDSERFDLQFHVDELTRNPERRLAFSADSPDAFFHWQSQLRSIITRVLGLEGRTRPQPVAGEWLADWIDIVAKTGNKQTLTLLVCQLHTSGRLFGILRMKGRYPLLICQPVVREFRFENRDKLFQCIHRLKINDLRVQSTS